MNTTNQSHDADGNRIKKTKRPSPEDMRNAMFKMRTDAGFSQQQFADILGTHVDSVASCEQGRHRTPLPVYKLAVVLFKADGHEEILNSVAKMRLENAQEKPLNSWPSEPTRRA